MRVKGWLILFFSVILTISGAGTFGRDVSASVVSDRLKKVRKEFSAKSRMNQTVYTNTFHVYQGREYGGASNGGCDALVAYTTLKVFHNAFQAGAKTYSKVGSTSTKNTSRMNKLFQKAKIGDVIYWSKGDNEYHAAIFLKRNSKGVYMYEANFSSKNMIYDNHLWKYGKMQSWSGGATTVTVYRSKNYTQVNQKKAARKLSKGAVFQMNGVTYKVLDTSYRCGKVKVVRQEKNAKAAKYIGLNYETARLAKKYLDGYNFDGYTDNYVRQIAYMTSIHIKKTLSDEQLFKVVK